MKEDELEQRVNEYGLPILKKKYADGDECREHQYETVNIRESPRGFNRIDIVFRKCGKKDMRFNNHIK